MNTFASYVHFQFEVILYLSFQSEKYLNTLIPLEKYNIFKTKLCSHFDDVNLFEDVCNLIAKKNITVDNYRNYDEYYDELTGLAIAYHEIYSKYRDNTYQLAFASLFQNETTKSVILDQIAKHEHTTIDEIIKMDPISKFRKGSTILFKEMILAVIETKLNVDQY